MSGICRRHLSGRVFVNCVRRSTVLDVQCKSLEITVKVLIIVPPGSTKLYKSTNAIENKRQPASKPILSVLIIMSAKCDLKLIILVLYIIRTFTVKIQHCATTKLTNTRHLIPHSNESLQRPPPCTILTIEWLA